MEIFRKRAVFKVTEEEKRIIEDTIAVEKRLRILANGQDLLSLYCSPSMIRELITGLVMTEGIVEGGWCAERISIEYGDEILADIPAEGQVTEKGAIRTSGCIGGITYAHGGAPEKAAYAGKVSRDALITIFGKFQNISRSYRLTGCIHSAAIAEKKNVIIHAEDIGRHNAVDKIIGYCLIENIPMDNKIMLVSGRLSSEIAYKCARWKIPIVASRTAPTLRAVETAEQSGITLIGFLREKRFNIYSRAERIL